MSRAVPKAGAGLLVAALAAGILTGCASSGKETTADATVTSCTPAANGANPTAAGRVTNSSSKSSSFLIRIVYYDSSGNRVAEGVDTVGGVDPGQSAEWHSTASASANGPITCKVTSVNRVASP